MFLYRRNTQYTWVLRAVLLQDRIQYNASQNDRESLSLLCRISISSMMLVAAHRLTTSLEMLLWMLPSVVHGPQSALYY